MKGSAIVVSFVRKFCKSALVMLKERLPIQIPCSERLDEVVRPALLSSFWDAGMITSSLSMELEAGANTVDELAGVGSFPFLAFRSAFLDGGSGALMSTSSSSGASVSLLRFLEGCGGCAKILGLVTVFNEGIVIDGESPISGIVARLGW